jgi:signal transduction histidine kinase
LYLLGVNTDITARKRAEGEQDSLIAELEARNAELERFTYTVSHDLKSPLITIKGFLGFLEQDAIKGDVERVRADVTRIANAADKMQRLLDELLELSRIGRIVNPPEAVPLTELAREAVDMLSGRLTEHGVAVDIAPDLPLVYGDRQRLNEVLENLVDNAVKFMGDQPEPLVEIGARQDGAETVIYVRDNGGGIDPRYQDKVFGLFEKLDADSEGSGIGLAIVRRIVEVHGGRIWVESEGAGQGSAFCFTLQGGDGAMRDGG